MYCLLQICKHCNKAELILILLFILHISTDLKELHKYYSDIVRSLPDDYMESVQQLLHILTDEQICSILGCTSSLDANQMLTDCLIEKVESKLNILDFCENLEKIKNLPKLKNVIEHLRKGLCFNQS